MAQTTKELTSILLDPQADNARVDAALDDLATEMFSRAYSQPHAPRYSPFDMRAFRESHAGILDAEDGMRFRRNITEMSIDPWLFLQYATALNNISGSTVQLLNALAAGVGLPNGPHPHTVKMSYKKSLKDLLSSPPMRLLRERHDLVLASFPDGFHPGVHYWGYIEHEEHLFSGIAGTQQKDIPLKETIIKDSGSVHDQIFRTQTPFGVGSPMYFGVRLPSVIARKACCQREWTPDDLKKFYSQLDLISASGSIALYMEFLTLCNIGADSDPGLLEKSISSAHVLNEVVIPNYRLIEHNLDLSSPAARKKQIERRYALFAP